MSNYVISMPVNTFSMPRQFKAVANGKIYVGIPDTDPANPDNHIPVYIVNESGEEVQVAQPILINAGGFPVYNGQIAKFITKQNYSMAVTDSYNAQQFYWPDLSSVDPAAVSSRIDELIEDLAKPTGAGLIGTTSGNTVQGEIDLIRDNADIRQHGAKPQNDDNSSAILAAMAASPGGIIVRGGIFKVGNITIDSPIQFEAGAGISVNAGATMIIRNRVSAGIYKIFYGDGNISFQHKDPIPSGEKSSGEQSRYVHVAWFGASPNGNDGDDLAPLFQKVSDSLGNIREAEIKFDVGTYTQRTGPVIWPRAVKLLGAGDRLTNIWTKFLTGDVWKTGGGGMNAHNFQFNCDDFRVSGCYIRFDHERCEAYDIYMDHGYRGIGLYGYECKAYRSKGLSWSQAVGSSLIDIGHDDCVVEDTDYTSSVPIGPECIVRFNCETRSISRPQVRLVSARTSGALVGATVTGAFSFTEPTISELKGNQATYLVKFILSGSASPNVIQISGLVAGPSCQGCVQIISTSGSVFGLMMDEISGDNTISACIDIQNNGSGNIRPIILGQHDLRGATGLKIGGSGTLPSRVSLTGGAARNCTSYGYDLKCQYLSAFGLVGFSNTSGDMVLQPGTDVVRVIGNVLTVTNNSGGSNVTVLNNL
ncbi:phage tailspike protein [Atlantibacter hermannii]|uniref:phage tailspike protein n=1 Tax=Atlantibacter hermannii TaxID=565 RepID=UPI0028A685A9|nr:phage tailspike protein [Atlantibacter hermannii]